MKGRVVMAVMAATLCWLCSCHVNSQPDQMTVTVIPHGTTSTFLAISGKGFSPKTSENQVSIGSTEVRVVSANAHRLIVKVPGHLKGTVPVSVKVKEQSSNVAYLRYPSTGTLADAARP
ncbi:MAG TPA: IPT/TIG domain-containing protein [Chitinophaga sp.]